MYRYGVRPSTKAPAPSTMIHGFDAISRRAFTRTNRATIGTTVIASPWFETHRPASNAPRTRSRSRRSARHTSARWRSSATSSRWRPFISENVASSQSVPVKARASAAPVAMTGRTPRRTAMSTAIPTAPAAATAESRLAR